jgi:cysteine-rich repeat protein
VVATNEGCDDNNVSYGDGCSGKCKVEVGFKCTGSLSVCTGICGNSQLQTGEQCDDGNTKDSDGCSASCTIEASSSSS